MRAKTHGKTPFFKRNCVFLFSALQYLTYPASVRNFMPNWPVICVEYVDIQFFAKFFFYAINRRIKQAYLHSTITLAVQHYLPYLVIFKLIGQIDAQPGNRMMIILIRAEDLISSFDKFVRESGWVIKNKKRKFGHILSYFVCEYTML